MHESWQVQYVFRPYFATKDLKIQSEGHQTYLGHLQTVLCLHSGSQSSKECNSCTEVNFPLA